MLSFPFAIRNQLLTSLSTLRAAVAKREELLSYQRSFYREALDEAAADAATGLRGGRRRRPGAAPRPGRGATRATASGCTRSPRGSIGGGERFEPGHALVVPLAQRQYRLLRALFEERTEFPDTTFYDVSAWTLPLAFGLPWAELRPAGGGAVLSGAAASSAAAAAGEVPLPAGSFEPPEAGAAPPVAYAFEWTGYYAPRALEPAARRRRRDAGRHPTVRGARRGRRALLRLRHGRWSRSASSRSAADEIRADSRDRCARRTASTSTPSATGLTGRGVDLGSPSLEPLERPTVLIVIGDGVSSYGAGEVWHHLDHRLGMEVALVDRAYLGGVDLSRYSHVVLPEGRWNDLPEHTVEGPRRVGPPRRRAGRPAGGGGLVGGGAARHRATASDRRRRRDARRCGAGPGAAPVRPLPGRRGGAADRRHHLRGRVDVTHPLAYGYTRPTLPVFRDTALTLTPSENPYDTPVRYAEAPLLAGYVSPENLERLAGTPAVIATRLGRGVVIRMVDDPVFRGYWHGTAKLLANAIFFGGAIDRTELPEGVRAPTPGWE